MNGPTPEQIAAEAPFPADLERLAFLARLTSNGYVIVHPDDVPTSHPIEPGVVYDGQRHIGWVECRRRIFAIARQEQT